MITVKVNKASDPGGTVPGTLRWALALPRSSHINIIIDVSIKRINLSDEIVITGGGSVTIIGHRCEIVASNHRHFHVPGSTSNQVLTLKSLRLTSGFASAGGAVLIENPKCLLTLHSVVLERNAAIVGGAVFTKGSLKIIKSNIQNNTALNEGSGVWVCRDVTMTDSSISHGVGSAAIINNGTLSMIRSCINGNHGLGVLINKGSIVITRSHIDYNTGGGIKVVSGDVLLNQRSSVNHNGLGGTSTPGIINLAGNTTLDTSKVSYNKGRGIASTTGNVTVIASEVSYNRGGIIALSNSAVTVTDSNLCYNVAVGLGGAIANLSDDDGQVLISNSNLSHNEVVAGDAGVTLPDGLVGPLGSAIATLSNCPITVIEHSIITPDAIFAFEGPVIIIA